MFDNIPDELKTYDQFCLWKYEDRIGDKATKVPYSAKDGRLASVSDSETWASYDLAVNAHRSGGYDGIGFILSEQDPYTFIDLDDTKGDQLALDRQLKIYQEFDSYAERSPSGSGLHIIVKGQVPSGRKRAFIEVYSSRRYMTMTGDVYRRVPIGDYSNLVNALWQQMAASSSPTTMYCGLAEQTDTDEAIIESMIKAENGVKANDLLVAHNVVNSVLFTIFSNVRHNTTNSS